MLCIIIQGHFFPNFVELTKTLFMVLVGKLMLANVCNKLCDLVNPVIVNKPYISIFKNHSKQ